jgi:XTP/dITP diphosphohydrolase
LEVDALAGRPGVHSARYAPDSPARIQRLLAEMSDLPAERRTARFQCVIALARPDGRTETTAGTCTGRIAGEARGNNGFGFDPVFYVPEQGATMAELPEGVKNQISHRARAAQKMRPVLERILSEA